MTSLQFLNFPIKATEFLGLFAFFEHCGTVLGAAVIKRANQAVAILFRNRDQCRPSGIESLTVRS